MVGIARRQRLSWPDTPSLQSQSEGAGAPAMSRWREAFRALTDTTDSIDTNTPGVGSPANCVDYVNCVRGQKGGSQTGLPTSNPADLESRRANSEPGELDCWQQVAL